MSPRENEGIHEKRDDFHHLNKDVEQDHAKLESLAAECLGHLYTIESEVFAYSFSNERPCALIPRTPSYWPTAGEGLVRVRLRNLL